MRIVGLFFGMCFMVLSTVAQTSRVVVPLTGGEWNWIERTDEAISALDLKKVNTLGNIDTLTTTMLIVTEIDIEESDFDLVVLNMLGGNKFFKVFANGMQLNNELSNENFHAEITSYVEDGKIVVMLNPIVNLSINSFEQLISESNIYILKGIFLCHIDVKTDPFFGGKLIDAGIKNFLEKDVDGKIYARLYTSENWELIAENNNCAFARSGQEGNIEINFPDFDSIYYEKPLIAEIVMVDKEQNEEIIDQLSVPVTF